MYPNEYMYPISLTSLHMRKFIHAIKHDKHSLYL